MQTFQLIRDHFDDRPTTGQLLIEGERFCYTLERPWLNNAPNVSCIPTGTYDVKWLWSNHFNKYLPHIVDVPGRSNIMFHSLNSVNETEGCVGLGDRETGYVLFNSTDALDRFIEWFKSVGLEAQVCVTTDPDTRYSSF